MNPSGQPYGVAPPGVARDPRQELNIPSVLLLVLGALGALTSLWGVFSPADLSQFDSLPMEPQAREMLGRVFGVLAGAGRLLSALSVLLGGVMAYGAWKMRELQQYPLAMASAIIGLLPLGSCCCCLSLPVGVWALTILVRGDVKDAFQG
jgi:hypothetical protein